MKDNNILKSLYILIFSSIIIVIVAFYGSKLEKTSLNNEEITPYDTGWYDSTGNFGDDDVIIPTKLELPKNTKVRISNILPERYVEGMAISLRSSFPNLRVFVDNIKIYEYGHERKLLFGRTTGSNYHIFRIPRGTEGTKITLEFNTYEKPMSGKISSIEMGSKVGILTNISQLHLLPFLICILIFIFGTIFIFVYGYMRLKFKEGKSLLYLGFFAILVAIWSATETKMLQFFIPYQFIENIISNLSLIIFPIPFLLFLKGASHSNNSKGFNILCTLFIIDFIVTNILTFIGVSDYMGMLPAFFILAALSVGLSLYTVLKEVIVYRNRDTFVLGISTLILAVFTILNFIHCYFFDATDASFYFRIGLLLFIILIGFSTFKKMIVMIKIGLNSGTFQKLAYTDILTNLKNRTAYVQDLDKLNESLVPTANVIAVIFDLNNLKEANDTYGHEIGDTLLIAAADCIKKALMDCGTCYRIGGDEFAAIVKDAYDITFLECMSDLNYKIKCYNENNAIKLEIPYGYTHYNPVTDRDLYGTFSRADALMYEAKAKMKASHIKVY